MSSEDKEVLDVKKMQKATTEGLNSKTNTPVYSNELQRGNSSCSTKAIPKNDHKVIKELPTKPRKTLNSSPLTAKKQIASDKSIRETLLAPPKMTKENNSGKPSTPNSSTENSFVNQFSLSNNLDFSQAYANAPYKTKTKASLIQHRYLPFNKNIGKVAVPKQGKILFE